MTTTINDIPDDVLATIINLACPAKELRLVSKKFDEQCGQVAIGVFRKLSELKITDEYCLLRHLVSETMPSFGAITNISMKALHHLYGRIGKHYSQKDFNQIHEALHVNLLSQFEQECQEASLIEFASIVELKIKSRSLETSFNSTEEQVKHIREWLQNNSTKIQQISKLTITSKKITRLPPEIALFQNLSKLQIQESSIPFLPKEIWLLKNLKALDVDNSLLEIFDVPDGSLPNLDSISLYNTKLKKYPAGIEKFKLTLNYLNLGATDIPDIPESIGTLTQLTYLMLYNAPLTTLPKSIGLLTKLRVLEVNWEKILSLPDEIVFQSPSNIRNMPQIYAFRWYGPLVNFLNDVLTILCKVPMFVLRVVLGTVIALVYIIAVVILGLYETMKFGVAVVGKLAMVLLEILKVVSVIFVGILITLDVVLVAFLLVVIVQALFAIILPEIIIEILLVVSAFIGVIISCYLLKGIL